MHRIAAALVGATLLLGACSTSTVTETQPAPAHDAQPSASESGGSQDVHWGYSGADGPQN